ncbi:reverse transcriptase [Senna tora]|uniref:Reverse transcriptase n=1 Tax=Senna tora TaxID=362788 RepID=A0A834XAN1_9FABA|nr:reverse transcriptase [Senna tora]
MALEDKVEHSRDADLEALDERRDKACQNHQMYQQKLIQAYDKLVRPRMFKEGELVMRATEHVMKNLHSTSCPSKGVGCMADKGQLGAEASTRRSSPSYDGGSSGGTTNLDIQPTRNRDIRPPSWRGRPPPPCPCSMEDVYALLEIWVRDGNIELPKEDNDNVVVAKGLAKSTNFRAFFDLLEFDEDAKAQAALSIVEIAQNVGGSCYAVESNLRKTVKAHHSAIIFKDTECKTKHANHNRPLYVEAEVAGLKVWRAMVDGGSSVNIIPYLVLKKTNYPEHLMEKSVTSLGSFNGSFVKTMGAVTLNLKVGPFVTANKLYVIDSHPSYHILLGRPWIHSHDAVPSTLHQCKGTSMSGPPVGIKLEKKKEKVEECKKKEGRKGCVEDTGASSSGTKKIMGDAVASSSGTKRHATEVFEVRGRFIERSIMDNGRPKYRCL